MPLHFGINRYGFHLLPILSLMAVYLLAEYPPRLTVKAVTVALVTALSCGALFKETFGAPQIVAGTLEWVLALSLLLVCAVRKFSYARHWVVPAVWLGIVLATTAQNFSRGIAYHQERWASVDWTPFQRALQKLENTDIPMDATVISDEPWDVSWFTGRLAIKRPFGLKRLLSMLPSDARPIFLLESRKPAPWWEAEILRSGFSKVPARLNDVWLYRWSSRDTE
jgi:hypothetical protein